MNMKKIDINDSLANIIKLYPELLDILFDFGFTQIKTIGMLQTAGKFMTLKMGCELRKIDIRELKSYLEQQDFYLN